MGLIANLKGIKYKIRIFHDYYHIKTVTEKVKGQRFITVLVDNPILGKKEKLAFMIPQDIKPFVFKGRELEFNYDIRDATPLSELTDLYPDLLHDLNEDIKTLFLPEPPKEDELPKIPLVLDAEFKNIENPEQKPPESQSEPTKTEVIKKKVGTAVKVTKDSTTLLKEIVRLHIADDTKKKEKIQNIMDLCAQYPKLLYWLPRALNLNNEIISLISAKAIYRTGVMPSYYAAQSGALISEKILERPKDKPSWVMVALVGVIGIIVLGMFFIVFRR